MSRRLKRLLFSLIPLLCLFATAEVVIRVKYFLYHQHDWNYLTMPFLVQDLQAQDHSHYVSAEASAAPGAPASAQLNFKWVRPCRDRDEFSEHYRKPMPYTWDANCFRGDPVTQRKARGEFRVFVLGGSTVEDAQPDIDMWTTHLKHTLDAPDVKVVNAGQAALGGSTTVSGIYDEKVRLFAPDMVLYYEAWNEQVEFSRWAQVNQRVADLIRGVGRHLYYSSAVYTYVLEKYAFENAQPVRFWKIDVARLQQNLEKLARSVGRSGARLVLVTQVINFPRHWKGIDTFDPAAVDSLLTRLEQDASYSYDTREISALNQRLTVFRSIETFRRLSLPVIDILDDVERLGEAGRQPLFLDLGHLTWRGDAFIGPLIGHTLLELRLLPERAAPASREPDR